MKKFLFTFWSVNKQTKTFSQIPIIYLFYHRFYISILCFLFLKLLHFQYYFHFTHKIFHKTYVLYGYIQQTNFPFHHKENKINQNNIIIDHYLIFIRLEMWKREFSHNNIVNETIFSEWETFLYLHIQKKLMEWTNQRKNRIKLPKQQPLHTFQRYIRFQQQEKKILNVVD